MRAGVEMSTPNCAREKSQLVGTECLESSRQDTEREAASCMREAVRCMRERSRKTKWITS